MIRTVVVGYGLAGRVLHVPLIRRRPEMQLVGVVARNPEVRAEAESTLGVRGYADPDEVLAQRDVELVVIATPHDTHEEQAVRTLRAGKHCVVDKVMALTEAECDRMIAARHESGRVLSVFHNRRWDWDYRTVLRVLADGRIGPPRLIESGVCRYSPPRSWRGQRASAGTILHDWGAHLIDQALGMGLGPCRRLSCRILPAPFDGVDSGGHGVLDLHFAETLFRIEVSRMCRQPRPRWSIVGTAGGFVKYGVDPQEDALRRGDLDSAAEPPEHEGRLHLEGGESPIETVRASWDDYYRNIAEAIDSGVEPEVTAEQAREVVRVLEAAEMSDGEGRMIAGPWGRAG